MSLPPSAIDEIGNVVAIMGTPNHHEVGLVGNCAISSGTNTIRYGQGANVLGFSNTFSVAFWVFVPNGNDPTTYVLSAGYRESATPAENSGLLFGVLPSGNIYWRVEQNSSTGYNGQLYGLWDTGLSVTTNRWNLVLITRTQTTATTYIRSEDGVTLSAVQNISKPLLNLWEDRNHYTFATRPDAAEATPLYGASGNKVDSLLIYNRDLTLDEFDLLYNNGDGVVSNPSAPYQRNVSDHYATRYYKMNEKDGVIAYEQGKETTRTHGTYYNNPTLGLPQQITLFEEYGGSVQFGGGSYMEAPGLTGVTGQIAVEFIATKGSSVATTDSTIGYNGITVIYSDAGVISVQAGKKAGTTGGFLDTDRTTFTVTETFNDALPHHIVAFMHSSTTPDIYVDGEIRAHTRTQGVAMSQVYRTGAFLTVNKVTDGTGVTIYNGRVSEVAIYGNTTAEYPKSGGAHAHGPQVSYDTALGRRLDIVRSRVYDNIVSFGLVNPIQIVSNLSNTIIGYDNIASFGLVNPIQIVSNLSNTNIEYDNIASFGELIRDFITIVYSPTSGSTDRWAHYHLEDISGTTATNAFGVNGTYIGSPALNQPPIVAGTAGCVLFNGIDQKVIGRSSSYTSTPPIMIGAWCKTTSTSEQVLIDSIDSAPIATRKGVSIVMRSDGRVEMTGYQSSNVVRSSGLSTSVINDGLPHLVVGYLTDANTWHIAVDGVVENTTINTPTLTSNKLLNNLSAFTIGATADNTAFGGSPSTNYFSGYISHVFVYDSIINTAIPKLFYLIGSR